LGSACTLCFIALNCAAVTSLGIKPLGIKSSLPFMLGLQLLAQIYGFHNYM
jgi:hypothetical protein